MLDAKGKALRAHRKGCRPKYGYVFDAAPAADGKRQQVTKTGLATRKEAERELRAALEAEENGLRVETGRLTVGQYLDEWLAGRHALRPSTARSYEAHVRVYLKPALGRLRLSDLRHADVARMFAALVLQGRPAPATLRRVYATLNKAMNDAVRRNLRVNNPAEHVELPAAVRPRFEVWTPSQLAHFLDGSRGDRHWALYRLAAMTGLRRGELAGLRWSAVDLEIGVLHVRQQRVQIGYEVVEGPPKSQTGERVVQLDPSTVEVLRDHALTQEAERVLVGDLWHEDDYLFCREDGRPLHPEFITRHFGRLVRALGLPVIRLHDLRHTHASHGLAAGVPLKVIQERLGHSSLALTADTYTHVLPQVASDAAAIIARLTLMADPSLAAREQQGRGAGHQPAATPTNLQVTRGGPPGDRTLNPRIKRTQT